MGCNKFEYLDKNGDKHPRYYQNLHLGHNRALSLYLEAMEETLQSSFSKQLITVEDLVEDVKSIPKGASARGGAHASLDIVKPFMTDDKVSDIVYRAHAVYIRENIDGTSRSAWNDLSRADQTDKMMEYVEIAKEYYRKHPKEFERQKKRRTREWDADTDEKSDFHSILEEYVNARNKVENKEDISALAEKVINKRYADRLSTKTMIRRDVSMQMLAQFEKFLSNELGRDPDSNAYPEVTVDVQSWGKRGKIDLMIYFPNTQALKVYDFKFFNAGNYGSYDTGYGKLRAPADMLENSKKVHNDLQMSIYRAMLEKKGLNVKSISTFIIPFIAGKEDEDGSYSTDNISQFTTIEMQKIRETNYQRNIVEQIFKAEGIDIIPEVDTWADEKYPDAISTVADLSELMIDKSAIKSNNIGLTKSSDLDSVKIIKSSNNNYYYYNSIIGSDVILKGTDTASRLDEIRIYLEKKKDNRDETVDLVLDYLYSDKKKWGTKKKNAGAKDAAELAKSLLDQIRLVTKYDHSGETLNIDIESTMDKVMKAKFYRTEGKEEIVNTLFAGMDAKEWSFSKINSDPRFESVDLNIIVARRGNQIKLIALTDTFESDMQFVHDNNDKYTNILGNFISDDKAKLLEVTTSSNSFNMELLTMQLIMKEMQYSDPTLEFEPAKVGRLRGGRGFYPKTMSLGVSDNIVNRLIEITGDDISPAYAKVLSTPLKKATDTALDTYVDVLVATLNNSFDWFYKSKITTNINLAFTLASSNIHDGKNVKKVFTELKALMEDIQKEYSRSRKEGNIYYSSVYNDIANLMLTIRGIDPKIVETDAVINGLGIIKNARTMGNMGSAILSKMDQVYRGAKSEVFQEYEHRRGLYNTLVGKLMQQKNISKADIERSGDIRRSIFSNLYEEWDPENPIDVRTKMMKFKNPTSSSLIAEEKALIEFMIKTQREMAVRDLGESVIKEMEETGKYHPLMVYVAKQSDETKADAEHWNYGKRVLHTLKGLKDRVTPKTSGESITGKVFFNYSVYNPFSAQLTSSSNRIEILGYNIDGEIPSSKAVEAPETNLDIVFEDVVLGSLIKERYEDALAVKAAVDNMLIVNDMRGEARSEILRKVLDSFTDIIMMGYSETSRNETKTEKGVKDISSLTSAVILSGSLSYILTDSLVNAVNTVGETLTQGLLSVFTDQDPDFTFKDLAWAVNFMIKDGDLAEALMFKYSMIVRDPEKLRDPRFRKTMAKLFTSKSFYWLNALPIEYAQGVVLISKMRREGSMQAHSLSEFGVIEYDETKDKRFFKQSGENISDREEKRRKSHYELTKKYLTEEAAGINDDGRFLRAYTNIDIMNIQTLTTERFASLSSDQKILWETTAIGIAFTRFKNWLVAKSEVWWRSRNEDAVSTHDIIYTEDENGEMQAVYQGRVTEGIFQTVGYLLGYLKNNGRDFSKLEMDLGRKQNMARMTVDLSMWVILWLLAKGLFFKDEYQLKIDSKTGMMKHTKIPKSDMENTMMRIYRNATGDLTFIIPMYDTFFSHGSNLFPIMSVAQRILASGIGMVTNVADSDNDTTEKFDAIWHGLNSVARVSGGVRTVEDFGGWGLSKIEGK